MRVPFRRTRQRAARLVETTNIFPRNNLVSASVMAEQMHEYVRGDAGRSMVWTTNEPRRRVYPYCVIREAEKRARKRYELVITYGTDVRSVERFSTVTEARRRADEWFQISHRPLIFTTRRLEAYLGQRLTLRRLRNAFARHPFDALSNWLFGLQAESPVKSRADVHDAREEDPQ